MIIFPALRFEKKIYVSHASHQIHKYKRQLCITYVISDICISELTKNDVPYALANFPLQTV
jgi:hypothetical protein